MGIEFVTMVNCKSKIQSIKNRMEVTLAGESGVDLQE